MPSRCWNASGYCGLRTRPSGMFYTEIRFGDTRLSLSTYKTVHEAARSYDTAVCDTCQT